jgi:biotin carboxylase
MGLETVVASYDISKYPGFKLADIPEEADTTDIDKILKLAKRYKVKGVFTTGTDVALKALGKVNDELKLSGPSYKACLLSTDKLLMKRAFVSSKVKTADFFEASSEKEGLVFAERIGFPVMVKAINSSGSRGISQAKTPKDFKRAWRYSKKYTKGSDPIIIEEYLKGIEFGAQAFISSGKLKMVCIHNDTVTPPPCSTPIGHSYPFVKKGFEAEVEEEVRKAVVALGINNSALNVDLIKTRKGVKVLEVGARMGATCLPELTSIYTGVDVLEECIKMAIGIKPKFKITAHQPVAGLLLRSSRDGRVKEIKFPAEINKDLDIDHLDLDVQIGSRVKKFLNGTDRIGEIVCLSKSYKSAEKKAEDYAKKVKIIVE